MIPSVPTQYDDALADRMTSPDRVAHGVWSIPLTMPDPRNPYSFCYAIEAADGSVHLLDTGYDSDANWQLLQDGLTGFGLNLDRVTSVFVTHLHPDHLGLADRVRAATGATVGMLRREQEAALRLAAGPGDIDATLNGWAVPHARRDEILTMRRAGGRTEAMVADVLLEEGDEWVVPGRTLELVATPGHTPGHACVVDRDAGVIFSGDHVLPKIYPGLGLCGTTPTNPIADYFRSLARVEEFDALEVAPGHGYRFRGLTERSAEIREHHLRRSREAERVMADQPEATIYELASQLPWTAGWENLRGFFLYSALSQTELHLGFIRSDDYLSRPAVSEPSQPRP